MMRGMYGLHRSDLFNYNDHHSACSWHANQSISRAKKCLLCSSFWRRKTIRYWRSLSFERQALLKCAPVSAVGHWWKCLVIDHHHTCHRRLPREFLWHDTRKLQLNCLCNSRSKIETENDPFRWFWMSFSHRIRLEFEQPWHGCVSKFQNEKRAHRQRERERVTFGQCADVLNASARLDSWVWRERTGRSNVSITFSSSVQFKSVSIIFICASANPIY